MSIEWKAIEYQELNARQKENYNYHQLSAVLADFGFTTLRLTDDWQGADFIAQHITNGRFLKVQLKGRLTFDKSYIEKDIYIAFRENSNWYIYPHDELFKIVSSTSNIQNTLSWQECGGYSFPYLTSELLNLMEAYRIPLAKQRILPE